MNTIKSTIQTLDSMAALWAQEAYKTVHSFSRVSHSFPESWLPKNPVLLAATTEPAPDMDDGPIWE